MAAEIERGLTKQRTRAAPAAKKAAGVKLGCRGDLADPFLTIIEDLEHGMKRQAVARRCGVIRSTLYRWMKIRGIEVSEDQ